MIRRLLRRITFDHVAVACVALVTAGLYYLAADALLHVAAPAPRPARARADAAPPAGALRAAVAVADTAAAPSTRIADVFDRIGYHLDAVRQDGEVPRVFMASLPSDLSDIAVPKQRKVMFIETALPLILHVNELIAHDRARLLDLRDRIAAGKSLSAADAAWLGHETAAYGLDRLDIRELLRRVDVIPPSLALAQSAEESGWGTSRFAQQGNALFGQRTWTDDDGLVPTRRGDGERYRVAAFDQLMDAVKSYARNLNTHPAYADFRRARADRRRDDDALDGFALAGTLGGYSERGPDYVAAVRAIIRGNDLDVFDHARLDDRVVAVADGAPNA